MIKETMHKNIDIRMRVNLLGILSVKKIKAIEEIKSGQIDIILDSMKIEEVISKM